MSASNSLINYSSCNKSSIPQLSGLLYYLLLNCAQNTDVSQTGSGCSHRASFCGCRVLIAQVACMLHKYIDTLSILQQLHKKNQQQFGRKQSWDWSRKKKRNKNDQVWGNFMDFPVLIVLNNIFLEYNCNDITCGLLASSGLTGLSKAAFLRRQICYRQSMEVHHWSFSLSKQQNTRAAAAQIHHLIRRSREKVCDVTQHQYFWWHWKGGKKNVSAAFIKTNHCFPATSSWAALMKMSAFVHRLIWRQHWRCTKLQSDLPSADEQGSAQAANPSCSAQHEDKQH